MLERASEKRFVRDYGTILPTFDVLLAAATASSWGFQLFSCLYTTKECQIQEKA